MKGKNRTGMLGMDHSVAGGSASAMKMAKAPSLLLMLLNELPTAFALDI